LNRVNCAPDLIRIRNVLVSVWDKRDVVGFARGLLDATSARVLSTGGTYRELESGLEGSQRQRLGRLEEYTGQPEMQGGLVKTLDFKLYVGILSEPFNEKHAADRDRLGADLIDMVVVNLYPFGDVVRRAGSDIEDARSNIDIGGPCLLRAAAKSYLRVVPVCDPDDYSNLVGEIRERGGVSLGTRLELAKKAFEHTASYDREIADFLSGTGLTAVTSVMKIADEGE